MDNEVKEVTFFSENKHLKGYLRTPRGKPPFPAVLMFHGGIVNSEKNTLKMVNGREAEALLQEGFLVFSADWRTLEATDDPSKLRRSDAREAYNYLKSMNEVNSGKIVCCGHSAGATTAVWTAIQTEVKGTAAIAGILDYGQYAEYGAAVGKTFITDILFPTLGEDFKRGKRYQLASPIHFAAGIQSPLFIIHGSEDQIVPVEQAYLFEKTLKKYGKDFQMTIVENGSHKVNSYKKTIIRMVEFFEKCLKEN